MPYFRVFVNPLVFHDIESPVPGQRQEPSAEAILKFLCTPEQDGSPEAFTARYKEVAAGGNPLPVAPAEPTLLSKLFWPLLQAKGSYALANYLGCIALCGMVGEMVAVLLWDISRQHIGQPVADRHGEVRLFGREFERLGQERRSGVLRALGIIGEDTERTFEELRIARNRYLHLLSHPHTEIARDARECYAKAVKLTIVALGMSFKDGAVTVRPELMQYLRDKGLVTAEDEPGSPEGAN